MPSFFAFWIPMNIIFWLFCAAKVEKPKAIHYGVAFAMAFITGVMPYILINIL